MKGTASEGTQGQMRLHENANSPAQVIQNNGKISLLLYIQIQRGLQKFHCCINDFNFFFVYFILHI